VLVVVVLAAGIIGLKQMVTRKGPAKEVPVASQSEIDTLIQKVASHIQIKKDEQPTIATIQDAETLRTQNAVFYKDAQNGDRLLIWSDKAVLYSTSQDLILAVLPVSLLPGEATTNPSSETSTTTSQTPTQETAVIEVRNGAKTPGLGRTMVDRLKASGLTVLTATDAKVKTYEKTVIVKANDKPLPETLKTLQAVTKAEVIAAPEAEGALKGDFLVIVGADFTP
jgi:hypothetical protein